MSASARPNLVLITGSSGHVGAMVLDELLQSGYRVRATARAHKVQQLEGTYPDAGDQLEVVEIKDILMDDWRPYLKGQDVEAVIHVAAAVYHPGVTSEDIYKAAITGTRNLLNSLEGTAVRRFVLTGSIGVFFKPDMSNLFEDVTFNHNSWSDIDDIDPKDHTPEGTYMASKAIAEKYFWKIAEKYPNIDFTVVHPPACYGNFLPNYPVPKSVDQLNANKFIYGLFQKDDGIEFPTFPVYTSAHNRDVARVHVRSLTAPALPGGEKKRLIVFNGGYMTWVDAIGYLKEKRPELIKKLPDVGLAKPAAKYKLDTSLTERVVGMKQEDYVQWQEVLLEVVDYLMEWEKVYSDNK